MIIDLKNTIVTADAMNCQKDTVSAIVKSKGDYVLAIKGNQKLFYNEVKEYFNLEELKSIKRQSEGYYKTVDKEHGGIATREYFITEDINWFSEKNKWKNLNSFGMVKKTLKKKNGEIITENRYYIASIGLVKSCYSSAKARFHHYR